MVLRYKRPAALAQMNLLDSHDVPRFLTKCGGDESRFKLAVFFMMVFVGVPSVFYGDEAGISGETEEEYRRPMPWGALPESGELYARFKELITLRRSRPSLTEGAFRTVLADSESGLYVFLRETESEKLMVLINNSDEEKMFQSCDLPNDAQGGVSLAPMEGKVICL